MMSGIQSKITMYGKKENVLYNTEKKSVNWKQPRNNTADRTSRQV